MADIRPDRTLLLSLRRRNDRRDAFYREVDGVPAWPFDRPEWQPAVDGSKLPSVPEGWAQMGMTAGAYACTQSYARIIEDALDQDQESVLVFEDDCFFVDPPSWSSRVGAFLSAVPDDWDAVYLGGNHRMANSYPPVVVNGLVLRAYMLTATHAFIMRRTFMQAVYPRLHAQPPAICDLTFARVMREEQLRVYTPHRWFAGQRAMGSDIASGFQHDSTFDLLPHKPPRPAGSDLYARKVGS